MADGSEPGSGELGIDAVTRALLDIRTWGAFDVDDEGRVLAGSDDFGSVQLVEIDVDGSRHPLTNLPSRCSGRYVPGRRAVVVMHDNGGDEKWQLSLLDCARRPDEPATLDELTPLVHDPRYLHVLSDVTADSLAYHTNRRNGTDMDVIVRDLRTGDERTVYDGGGYVGDLSLSHARTSVAITSLSLQPASSHVSIAGPDGAVAPVTDPRAHELNTAVAWAAGDAGLLVTSNHDREFTAVCRVALDGSSWQELVADDARDVTGWVSRDGASMLVTTHDDGVTPLAVHEGDGTHRVDVPLPADAVVTAVAWSPDSTQAAVTVSTPTSPSTILRIDARTGRSRALVDTAESIPASIADRLVRPSSTRIPAPDGEQIPCFVYPAAPAADAEPGVAGASVLHVHGGPEGVATRAFSPIVQALALAGFTVLVPNVRGSAGYGKRWVSLDDVDKRLDSVADLAAIHAWLPSQGLDPRRAALWGGSYGGYMVLAGVSMQPQRWAAGVDIVGISSLITFLRNTSSYRRAYREREYGSLEHDLEFLRKASPLTYLDQIRAPLFVIHGANDPRVPLSEAEQLAESVRGKGIACELLVYADEGHGLAKRANRLDAYPRAIRFLCEQLATRT